MGGLNEAVCPVPQSGLIPSSSSTNPVRFHENTVDGEIHFHDEVSKIKCAISSGLYFKEYEKWRHSNMSSSLVLTGHDGRGGDSSVCIQSYYDEQGRRQIAIRVDTIPVGESLKDLDKLVKT